MDKKKIESLIKLAQDEAEKAIKTGNPPFGSIITNKDGKVIASAHNTQNSSNDATAHAEINVIRKACKLVNSPRLESYHLFSNAESCSMCMSAAIKAKIRHFYLGAPHEASMDPQITSTEVADKSKNRLYIQRNILKESCIDQIKRGREELKKQNNLPNKK